MQKIIYGIPILAFLSLAAVFYIGLGKDPKLVPSALIGEPAPAIVLKTLSDPDTQITSETFEDQVVLINFFASWCGPCRLEHPLLMDLSKSKQLPIYGINYKDAKADVTRWLNDLGDPFNDIGVDLDGRVGIDWGVYGLPETFLINKQGQVVYKHVGPLTPSVLHDEILPLAKELQK